MNREELEKEALFMQYRNYDSLADVHPATWELASYEESKQRIWNSRTSMLQEYVAIGYYLRHIYEGRMFQEDNYDSLEEMAKDLFGMDPTAVFRAIKVNKEFSRGGYSPLLADDYKGYSKSVLIEILTMEPEERQLITPDMTVKKVREIKADLRDPVPDPISMEFEIKEVLPDVEPEIDEVVATSQDAEDILPQDDFCVMGNKRVPVATSQVEPEEVNILLIAFAKNLREKSKKNLHERDSVALRQSLIDEHGKSYNGGNSCMPNYCHYDCQPSNLRFWDGRFHKEVLLTWGQVAKQLIQLLKEDRISGVAKAEEKVFKTDTSDFSEALTDDKAWKTLGESNANILELERLIKEEKNWLTVMGCDGEIEAPKAYRNHQMTLAAYELLHKCYGSEVARQPKQLELPLLRNKEQREAWLHNYQEWGVWYEDINIGVRYYRFDLPDGAYLVANEYIDDRWRGVCEQNSRYHLIGGDKRRYNYHKGYCHQADSVTEIVEYMKNVQKAQKEDAV